MRLPTTESIGIFGGLLWSLFVGCKIQVSKSRLLRKKGEIENVLE